MKIKISENLLSVQTPAKVNLYLEVLHKRDDGFHEIESVVDPIDLYDELVFEKTSEGVEISCNLPEVPTDESNLVWRAWSLLSEKAGLSGGVRVEMRKSVPPGSGLGGGSSNAAGALVAFNMLYGLGLTAQKLSELGAVLGSDVPLFFLGKRGWMRGRGERIEPYPYREKRRYVLIFPDISVPTKKVYNNLSSCLTSPAGDDIIIWYDSSEEDGGRGARLFNRLESSAFELFPRLGLLKKQIAERTGKPVLMSGSGSTLFCLCKNEEDRNNTIDQLKGLEAGDVTRASSVEYDIQ